MLNKRGSDPVGISSGAFFDGMSPSFTMAYTYYRKNNDQFWNEPPEASSPERALLSAVLKQAIEDYTQGTLEESAEAEQWILGSQSELTSVPFEWLCHQLDFDPSKTAAVILGTPKRLREAKRKVRGHAP